MRTTARLLPALLLLLPILVPLPRATAADEGAAEAPPQPAEPAKEKTEAVPAVPLVRPEGAPATAPEDGSASETFAQVAAAYDEAYAAWRTELKKAIEAGEGAYPERPDGAFYARMRALADGGDPHATLWCLERFRSDETPEAYRADRWLAQAFRLAVAARADAALAASALRTLGSGVYYVGLEPTLALVRMVGAPGAEERVERDALYQEASLLQGQGGEARRAEAVARYEEIVKRWPDSPQAERAQGQLFVLQHLQVGMTAPELEGLDVDGETLRLSDLRGKVVLVEFWGFW